MDSQKNNFGLLGDSPQKAYVNKLNLFNRFAEPELRAVIAELDLKTDSWVLDAGCGTGLISQWLAECVPDGLALGIDLSTKHLAHVRHLNSPPELALGFSQADMTQLPLAADSFDLIWSSNAINHLHQPVDCLRALSASLCSKGWLVLGQSAFLPEMFFAWDARLEKEVMLACRQYYRDKYGLTELETTAARNLLGWMKQAGLYNVRVKTVIIERTTPLTNEEVTYFVEGFFKGYWDYRVQPYLTEDDWQTLQSLCDPHSADFCLHRPDFHHIQTFTVVMGQRWQV